jgi:hypothetical protein
MSNDTIIPPFPLQWPMGVARTKQGRHARSPFRTNFEGAVGNVVKSLHGFEKDSGLTIKFPVLSTNVDLMGRLNNNDPGAAAWFQMENQWVAFGVDRFSDTASNIQAIHHIIEARRTELRYGGLNIVRQTFRSFVALPAPQGSHWSDVLGVPRVAGRDQIEAAFRDKARSAHPDMPGGSTEAMMKLNAAKEAAMAENGR